jgi:hypothetical protein
MMMDRLDGIVDTSPDLHCVEKNLCPGELCRHIPKSLGDSHTEAQSKLFEA